MNQKTLRAELWGPGSLAAFLGGLYYPRPGTYNWLLEPTASRKGSKKDKGKKRKRTTVFKDTSVRLDKEYLDQLICNGHSLY